MIKKIFIMLMALLPTMAVKAQLGVGSWELYGAFGSVADLIETPSKVYYMSSGCLYSYDKDTDETYVYSINNKLNDNDIKFIRYNHDGQYLAVVYNNANIDLIYESGKVVNLGDIKDAVLTTTPSVNDIDFDADEIIVATNFGLVLFDTDRYEVKESGMYNVNISQVTMSDNYIHVYQTNPGAWKWVKRSDHINNYNKFVTISGPVVLDFYAVDDNHIAIVVNSGGNLIRYYTVDYDNNSANFINTNFKNTGIQEYQDGLMAYNASEILTIDSAGNINKTAVPGSLGSGKLSFNKSPERIWVGDATGVGQYDISGSAPEVIHARFLPEALTTPYIGWLYADDQGGVIGWERSRSRSPLSRWVEKRTNTTLSYVNYGHIDNVTPPQFSDGSYPNPAITGIVQSPKDPSVYYMTSWYLGLLKVVNGEVVGSLKEKAPFTNAINGIDIDSKGNIYIAQYAYLSGYSDTYRVLMCPADKEGDILNPDSWIELMPKSVIGKTNDGNWEIVAGKKSNLIYFTCWWYQGIAVTDTKGTTTNADDVSASITSFVDQDGKSTDWDGFEFLTIAENPDGNLIIGSPIGIVMVSNTKAGIDNLKFTRLKVPRNDGTNYADYLLEGELVTDIDFDASGRMWFATLENGVYHVSPDGSEILAHYTADNSSLPTNRVYSVRCDKQSNAVYFGTEAGLAKYNSTAAPAAYDYSEVYAYPNPVRPEYTGWIVIKNLMDNSLVKITDAAGKVFFNGISEGGMIAWDGCDASGNRVKTGVYYVFASNHGEAQSSAAVTKILVVQ